MAKGCGERWIIEEMERLRRHPGFPAVSHERSRDGANTATNGHMRKWRPWQGGGRPRATAERSLADLIEPPQPPPVAAPTTEPQATNSK